MDIWQGPLEKIDDYRWRIPKTYKQGMRVPGIIYADEEMIKDIRSDKAPEQVANVAFLPGIVNYSLAMPDIHWGYGMPIGGVVATDVDNGGVVGAGLVGYDINCLSADSFVFNELGYKIQIKDYEKIFKKEVLRCMDFSKEKEESTKIISFLKQKPKNKVLIIVTESGRQITATEDHPFYTKDGMKAISKIKLNEEVAIYPFDGVEYTEPNSDVIIDRQEIINLMLKLGKTYREDAIEQTLTYLENKNLLPLRCDSSQLPYLLRIMGYCFGDGTIYFTGPRKRATVCFWGQEEDLKKIKEDLARLGFESDIYHRARHHKIDTVYNIIEFDRKEAWLKVSSSSFAILLAALGVPIGNKSRKHYSLPKWLFKMPLWQKRLFLGGLFGTEILVPATLTGHGHGYDFYCPTLSMNKVEGCVENGKNFLEDIRRLLLEFGVVSHEISQRKEYTDKNGIVSYRLRLMVSNITENLITLYTKIGFEYNQKRRFLANTAVAYLRLKNRILTEGKQIAVNVQKFRERNYTPQIVYSALSSEYASERFIERSLYESSDREHRLCSKDLTFEEYIKIATEGLGYSGMVWEKVEDIFPIDYDDYVYDFTVAHKDHNFIANNFVVSNCGVRLIKTNLKENEVRPKIKDLVYGLFNEIPAGVGSKGEIRISEQEERQLLVEGAAWVVKKGYGKQEDLEYTEERGAIKGADPNAVSDRAYERGKRQSGTLGSGNHFLEIQVIDQIYDEEAAKVFDLEVGQITVMIHSGSRGLGYQICDDYSKGMIKCLQKYNINVPDRQLACAPVNSPEGQAYLSAMKCAANYAWANRQCLMFLTRGVFEKIFGMGPKDLGMDLVYDVAHNIAKIEKYTIDGKDKTLCVHRKGATRAFPPGHPELPPRYKKIGQPVIIPGDMGRNSYLLVGTEKAKDTFYSTCHGAGRMMSRSAAIKACHGRSISAELEKKGIIVKSTGRETLAEEAPEAYKDVNEVVSVVHNAGISKRVCRMRPLGVVKG